MSEMYSPVLKLRHDRAEMGFTSARIATDDSCPTSWCLRITSPADEGEYRRHLTEGSSMAFTVFTRTGDMFSGEAYVASISAPADSATLVVLAGSGPLQRQ